MSQTLTKPRSTVQAAQHRKRNRAATLAAAALVAFIVWLVSVPALGLDLTVGSGDDTQTVGLAMVVIVSLVAGGAAWALLALLERLFGRGRLVWQITAWSVLAVSLLGPLSLARTGSVLVTLLVMHVCVGVVLALGLARASRRIA